MVVDLLKDNLARSLGAAFVSEDQVEAMIRPALTRYGLPAAEIDEVVAEARANVRAWKQDSSIDLGGVAALLSAGSAGFWHALGVPTRGEIAELSRRLDELAKRIPAERKPASKSRARPVRG